MAYRVMSAEPVTDRLGLRLERALALAQFGINATSSANIKKEMVVMGPKIAKTLLEKRHA